MFGAEMEMSAYSTLHTVNPDKRTQKRIVIMETSDKII